MNIFNMMRDSSENIMGVGVLVKRNEESIDHPECGLELVQLSNTIISYDAFIVALSKAKQSIVSDIGFDKLSGINDAYCIVGETREKINGFIPLFLHSEHMKRIRILEGMWLGHLFTLNSGGYDRRQELGFIKLLYQIIMKRTGSERNKHIIEEIIKIANFFVTNSEGFRQTFGDSTIDNFITNFRGRINQDLEIVATVGLVTNKLNHLINPIYYEYCRIFFRKQFVGKNNRELIKKLLYGDHKTAIISKPVEKFKNDLTDIDYVEKSFIDYFYDESKKPVELVPETSLLINRRPIIETDIEFIKNLLPPPPNFLLSLLQYKEFIFDNKLDYELLRKELLMTLIFSADSKLPPYLDYENSYGIFDNYIQGEITDAIKYDFTPDNIKTLVHVAKTFKSPDGFIGLLHKYTPQRRGIVFDAIINGLLDETAENNKLKLDALLSGVIGFNYPVFPLLKTIWQPYRDLDKIKKIIGNPRIIEIEKLNLNKFVHRIYRISNKPNRRKHSNHNPSEYGLFVFKGYDHPYFKISAEKQEHLV
jgi:hypothetical protein